MGGGGNAELRRIKGEERPELSAGESRVLMRFIVHVLVEKMVALKSFAAVAMAYGVVRKKAGGR